MDNGTRNGIALLGAVVAISMMPENFKEVARRFIHALEDELENEEKRRADVELDDVIDLGPEDYSIDEPAGLLPHLREDPR